jgi:hypothetical protein
MKSDLFKTMYPEFNAWLRQGTGKASLADPYGSFKNYTALRDLYTAEYQKKFGSAAAIPPDLLSRAMMGNWDLDSAQWLEAISSDSNWGNVQGYKDRVSYFKDQWAAIFGASEFKDLEPPADLMHKYGVGQMGFDEIFETSIRDSAAFRAAFPDFEAFSQATFERTGKPPGTIQIGDYLERRADYIEMYKAVMEDPDAMPDMAVLGTALANNWSNTQWELSIKKNDPAYKNTPAFKSKGAAFDNYWKRVFGENSVPDGGLRDEYVKGAFTDPSYMWDEIKGTSEFRSQYALWDSFAAAQNAQGNVVMDDPGLYKRYQKAFYDAFANQGITVPGGFDRMFFSSGIDPGDFAQNIEKFSEQGEAYKWQSGEAPDLATTAGIADKTAGGDIRKKLSEAIKQRQVYVQSKFTSFQTEEKNNQIAQKI